MADFVVIVLLVIAVALALRSIYQNRKKGIHCSGCPSAGMCSGTDCKKKSVRK